MTGNRKAGGRVSLSFSTSPEIAAYIRMRPNASSFINLAIKREIARRRAIAEEAAEDARLNSEVE